MYKILLAALFLFLGTTGSGFCQTSPLSTSSTKAERLYYKADEYVKARDFDRALATLAEATSKDPNFAEAYLKAANLHKMMGNKAATFQNLEKGLQLLPYSATLGNYYFELAELYFDQGKYQQAKERYADFLKAKPRKPAAVAWAKQQMASADFAEKAMQQPIDFKPVALPQNINSFRLQYFPYTTADQRFFIYTARVGIKPEQDENIYVSQRKGDSWQAPVSISDAINSSANEGAATISGDGKTLVFTSCNRPDSQGDCDLYISFRTGDDWSKPKNIGNPVNSKAWDSQPSLSADGRTLYFSSTRGGGVGKEDIWLTQLNEDGTWTKPVNLGEPVNSTGRDMAPSIHSSGSTLYFVSDGHPGMGGLDVFMATREATKQWSAPKNLGYPLNTPADEGSLFITSDNKAGFYSRQINSDDGYGTIQLYQFEVPQEWRSSVNSTYAQGRVLDIKTKKPVEAQVQLYDVEADSLVQQVGSDKISGEYTVVLTEGKQYALYVSAPRYLMNSLSFDYTSKKALTPVALDVYLEPLEAGAAVVLHNLFFDSGNYDLKKNSKTELDKLIAFLKLNGQVKVEISGHTDDVGSDSDNLVLSEKRAKAVVDYLAAKGISKNRIRYKGYGETKPQKPNTSEENRQQNRRIEMRVL
ncbi:OmpA family protein [Pontibacter liquoris]|uniref:OmpA family protein n=1 Tax=Pontibacter liquoris TaxID=2905677 RepID=UPI001FA7CBE8|nr:OmpA family protein [Pontibacter liquoris]